MLTREQIQSGYPPEWDDFSSLLGRIDAEAWARPSRCEGWAVSDVAAHVIGILADVFSGRMEGIGTAPVHTLEKLCYGNPFGQGDERTPLLIGLAARGQAAQAGRKPGKK